MRVWPSILVTAFLAGCAQPAIKQPAHESASPAAEAAETLQRAEMLMLQQKFGEAREILRHFTTAVPSDWQGVVDRGDRVDIAYWNAQEVFDCSPVDAKRLGKNIVWMKPSYSRAWYLLAFMAVERGNYAEANQAIDRGLALEPDQPTLLNEKATIAQQSGKHEEAIALNRKVIDSKRCTTSEALSRAWRSQAVSLTELGDLDEAEKALDESLKVDPGNPNTEREFIYIQKLRAKKPKVPITIRQVH